MRLRPPLGGPLPVSVENEVSAVEDPTEPEDRRDEIAAESDELEMRVELTQEEADAAQVELPTSDEDLAF